ncbi:hypothetical protein MTO96_020173 [Rhipicephalus appendiculatus]
MQLEARQATLVSEVGVVVGGGVNQLRLWSSESPWYLVLTNIGEEEAVLGAADEDRKASAQSTRLTPTTSRRGSRSLQASSVVPSSGVIRMVLTLGALCR